MWFDIIKLNKNLARQWVKNFIREHLESMSSGEKITTKEMLDLLFDNKENAHYVKSGKKFKFGNVNWNKHLHLSNIGGIMNRQNNDIVESQFYGVWYAEGQNRRKKARGYVVRK